MVKRRLKRAGLPLLFSNYSFRATGITTFLEDGCQLETAQRIAGHVDDRTTKGYDQRATRLKLSEIVRTRFHDYVLLPALLHVDTRIKLAGLVG